MGLSIHSLTALATNWNLNLCCRWKVKLNQNGFCTNSGTVLQQAFLKLPYVQHKYPSKIIKSAENSDPIAILNSRKASYSQNTLKPMWGK